MFVDGLELFPVLAQQAINGNILAKFREKNLASVLGGDATRTYGRKDWQTDERIDGRQTSPQKSSYWLFSNVYQTVTISLQIKFEINYGLNISICYLQIIYYRNEEPDN